MGKSNQDLMFLIKNQKQERREMEISLFVCVCAETELEQYCSGCNTATAGCDVWQKDEEREKECL